MVCLLDPCGFDDREEGWRARGIVGKIQDRFLRYLRKAVAEEAGEYASASLLPGAFDGCVAAAADIGKVAERMTRAPFQAMEPRIQREGDKAKEGTTTSGESA